MENEKAVASIGEVDFWLSQTAHDCESVLARESHDEVMARIDVGLDDVASGAVMVTGRILVRVDGLDILHLLICSCGPGFYCDPVGLDIGRLAQVVGTKRDRRILLFCYDNPLCRNVGLDRNPVTWI